MSIIVGGKVNPQRDLTDRPLRAYYFFSAC